MKNPKGFWKIEIFLESQKDSCEGMLTLKECEEVLKTFKSNKSPGNDGLTIEFYKKFWPLLGTHMMNSFNETYRLGELSSSQKQAVITLLDKGKDRLLLKNWRPISLLNLDYKIMSKVLAYRVKEVLPHIIHHDQTGYVKDRYIGEAVRVIQDIMEYTDVKKIPGIMLFIDFEKAFDSIEWNYVLKCLDKFNFGPSFCKWVRILYTDIYSSVINNGTTSGYFSLHRGVRQGDPLSPYLFIIGLEILSISIRMNDSIKGIDILGQIVKMTQYADDMNGFVADVKSAEHLLSTLLKFERVSGLKVNMDKTEAMWLGSMKKSKSKPLAIKWSSTLLKGLGVYHSYDKNEAEMANFKPKLKK